MWPRRVGGPKFRSFVSVARRNFHFFFSLFGVLPLNLGGVFEGPGASTPPLTPKKKVSQSVSQFEAPEMSMTIDLP